LAVRENNPNARHQKLPVFCLQNAKIALVALNRRAGFCAESAQKKNRAYARKFWFVFLAVRNTAKYLENSSLQKHRPGDPRCQNTRKTPARGQRAELDFKSKPPSRLSAWRDFSCFHAGRPAWGT